MLSCDVLAYGINNLSDARYFSAIGARWMGFEVFENETDIGQLKEVIDWIEGVEVLLHAEENNLGYVAFIAQELSISGILCDEQLAPACRKSGLHVTFGKSPGIFTLIGDNSHDSRQFLDLSSLSFESAKSLIEQGVYGAFALKGGAEEKVGLRAFDDVEELVELLESL